MSPSSPHILVNSMPLVLCVMVSASWSSSYPGSYRHADPPRTSPLTRSARGDLIDQR